MSGEATQTVVEVWVGVGGRLGSRTVNGISICLCEVEGKRRVILRFRGDRSRPSHACIAILVREERQIEHCDCFEGRKIMFASVRRLTL